MRSCTRGFTLIEVLIAVALSALVLTVVYSGFFSINRAIDIASEGREVAETGRLLMEIVGRDIRCTSPGKYPFVGKHGDIDGNPASQISFVTLSRSGTNQVRLMRVAYALVRDNEGSRVFIRKETSNLMGDETAIFGTGPALFDAAVSEVSRIVGSFDVGFYDGVQWKDRWEPQADNYLLPKMIRITFEILDEKGRKEKFTSEQPIFGTQPPPQR